MPKAQTSEQTNHLITYAAGPQRAQVLETLYAKQPDNPLEGDAGARFQTDRDFRCAVRQVAAWHASHGLPTYVYQFDRSAGWAKGAQRSSELRFVLGFPAAAGSAQGVSAEDSTVANEVQMFWTTFASTAAPTAAPHQPQWPHFEPAQEQYLRFASGSTQPVIASGLGVATCSILAG